jgi:hypothetical protein
MPGCGCGESYTAGMDNAFFQTDWELIKEDIRMFVRMCILEVNGEIINFCRHCGKELPPIEELA